MAKMLKTSAIDRKCKYPGCPHILSIYNHESFCHVHLGRSQNSKDPNKLLTLALIPAESEVVSAETL